MPNTLITPTEFERELLAWLAEYWERAKAEEKSQNALHAQASPLPVEQGIPRAMGHMKKGYSKTKPVKRDA